jgi:hypothetical protein
MFVSNCSRATFYKYVTKGSEIEREIEVARYSQRKYLESLRDDNRDDPQIIISALRLDLDAQKEANRQLLANTANFISNLIESGIPISIIQACQERAMSKPNRSISGGKKRRSL